MTFEEWWETGTPVDSPGQYIYEQIKPWCEMTWHARDGEVARLRDAMSNLEDAMNDNFAGRQVSVIGPPVIVQDTQNLDWHMIQAFVDIGPAKEPVENQAG